jgi:hypothetical protein
MRISQLITRLQEIQSRFGDLEVNNAEAESRGIQYRYPGRVWVRTIKGESISLPWLSARRNSWISRKIVVFPVTGEPIS